MIDLFPFSGFPVAVLGLGQTGLATARALDLSGAEVMAWDDDPDRRDAATEAGIPLRDPALIEDWREVVSLVIEHDVPHHGTTVHDLVTAARAAGTEVICDVELLARAQRDARFVAVASRGAEPETLDLIGHVLAVTGNDCEIGGDPRRPVLDLHPLELGGTYVLGMPPGRADTTLSITFDAAVVIDTGLDGWGGYHRMAEVSEALDWLFHRQTGGRGAVVGIDTAPTRRIADRLRGRKGQTVIGVSGRRPVRGGVYPEAGALVDDIGGTADRIMPFSEPRDAGEQASALRVAATYATARMLGVPPHAAMAALRAHLETMMETPESR